MDNVSKYNAGKMSRAVIAVNGSEGTVLWAVGAMNDEIQGDGADADSLGLLDIGAPPTGVWVWEGIFASFEDGFGAYTLPEGSFRVPTEAEWKAIHKGECPWQDGLWLDTRLLRMC